jgi:hypothetical protein
VCAAICRGEGEGEARCELTCIVVQQHPSPQMPVISVWALIGRDCNAKTGGFAEAATSKERPRPRSPHQPSPTVAFRTRRYPDYPGCIELDR